MNNTKHTTITSKIVRHIAKLANIPVTAKEEEQLAEGFNTTLEVVNQLKTINTDNIEPTHQVTGLINVLREDTVDEQQMFTQEQALANAKNTHNGYFVVDQILEEK